jgi:hypothetical protein
VAKLTAGERKKMASSKFGLPGERKYPMPDKAHARLAKSDAAKEEHAGKLSEAAEEKIDRKADRILASKAHNASAGRLAAGHKNVVNRSTHHEKLRHC